MPEFSCPENVLECFCGVEFDADGRARVGLVALWYRIDSRIDEMRRCIIVEGAVGRSEIAVSRVLAWVAGLTVSQQVICHVAGESLARNLEAAIDGRGEALARNWIASIQGSMEIAADRIERPATPRLIEAAALARKAAPDFVLEAAFQPG